MVRKYGPGETREHPVNLLLKDMEAAAALDGAPTEQRPVDPLQLLVDFEPAADDITDFQTGDQPRVLEVAAESPLARCYKLFFLNFISSSNLHKLSFNYMYFYFSTDVH